MVESNLTQTQEVFDTGCKAIYLNNVSWTEYEKPNNVPRVLRCILIKRRLSRPPCEVARALHIKHSVTPRPDQYNYAARQVSPAGTKRWSGWQTSRLISLTHGPSVV